MLPKSCIVLTILVFAFSFGVLKAQDNPDSATVLEVPLEPLAEVEQAAKPEGGMSKLYEFIGRNLQYPAIAREKGIYGKVFVEFVVEADGSITNVYVLKGIGAGCDAEAVRVISMMPRWIPAMNEGKIVRQRMVLPIIYHKK
jgi:periplasmic protein TonB